jgi:hypothetical protein
MAVRLHRPTDDRVIEMMRSIALRSAMHVVVASLGDVQPGSEDSVLLVDALPEQLASQLATSFDAVDQIDDLDAAEASFSAAAEAVAAYAGTVGTGVHAMLFRRDGTVELALPNSGVQTIRSAPFAGFAEFAA